MHTSYDIVPEVEETPVERGIRLWWLGGPSAVLKTPHCVVYVDPYYCERRPDPQGFVRAIPNIFFPETVTRADLIISTHDHRDHCDQATLAPMVAHTVAELALAPSSFAMVQGWGAFPADRLHSLAPGERIAAGDVTLTAEPCRDWSDPRAVTFVLESQGLQVFIGGDTLYFDGLEEIGRRYHPDLAIFALARNNRALIDQDLYVDPPLLAQAARAVNARRVLPIHWDIWEAWVEDPHLVEPHLAGSGIEAIILEQGGSLLLTPPGA